MVKWSGVSGGVEWSKGVVGVEWDGVGWDRFLVNEESDASSCQI